MPATMPAELRAKFGTYVHDKDALKRELRDALVELDPSSASKRATALHALAEKQWPRFRLLADLAESIRHDLATCRHRLRPNFHPSCHRASRSGSPPIKPTVMPSTANGPRAASPTAGPRFAW